MPPLLAPALQVLGGVAQSIFSGAKKKEKDLEKFANSYTPNASIMDFYNKSLARYSANPYESQSYQRQQNLINRNLTTALNSSQTRRGGLGSLSTLVQGANDASSKAASQAIGEQGQILNQLGGATRMKAAEDTRKYDMLYNLKAMKAGQAAQTQNMGYKNIFGGLSNASMLMGGGAKKDSTELNPRF